VLFSTEFAPALEHLFAAYPAFTEVSKLPGIDDPEEGVQLAGTLFELGVVLLLQ
jgi:hypothetical protein